MPDTTTIEIRKGLDVEVEHLEPRGERGARVDVETDDGRKWRLDITRGGKYEVVTSWRDGELADLDEPEWLNDLLARIGRAAA
ncbi:hypothetical protein ACFQL1_16030 [Halomicroarcula sp. GCM10025709]|uniref:hypothetical protein n=1 Tax=Haloarcula TaxID=2237 RepID=UPI0024C3C3AB|nr:hypothetical protein [Halomicroarcula sp. YJ-61-S]